MPSHNKPSVDKRVSTGSRRQLLKTAIAGVSAVAISEKVLASSQSMETKSVPKQSLGQGVLDVVVIGGGFAGLTAARDLQRAGNESFVVLEAQDRVGGRVLNHELVGGFISEAGGQWIGPGQTAVADLARELGIGTFDSDYAGKSVLEVGNGRVAIDAKGGAGADPDLVNALESLAETIPPERPWDAPRAAEFDAMTLADWLDSHGVSGMDRATWSMASMLCTGTAPSTVSFLHFLQMISNAGGRGGHQVLFGQKDGAQETRFIGGSQVIATTIAEQLGSNVHYASPVESISDWDSSVVTVKTARDTYRARRVILAISPPLCSRITFSPELPRGRQELQSRWPAHAPMCKTAMVYTKPFWRDRGYNAQIFHLDGPLQWSYDNSPPDAEIGVINAFVRVAELPSNHAAAQETLASIYAKGLKDERLLEPLDYHLHDWGQDAYSLSCVSPMPPRFLTSGLMAELRRNVGGLIWSGTETSEIWAGYMDGAVRSGHSAALQALQGVNGSRGLQHG